MCCGAGAGGPEIFWGPGAGVEFFFKYTCSAVSLEDARTKKLISPSNSIYYLVLLRAVDPHSFFADPA